MVYFICNFFPEVDSVLRKKEAVGLIVAGFICEGSGVLKLKLDSSLKDLSGHKPPYQSIYCVVGHWYVNSSIPKAEDMGLKNIGCSATLYITICVSNWLKEIIISQSPSGSSGSALLLGEILVLN